MNVQELIDDHYHFHSSYQMDNFITFRNGLTAYGCYKQALREWYGRFSNMTGLYVEREKFQIDIEELEEKVTQGSLSPFDKRRTVLEIALMKSRRAATDKTIADSEREFSHFLSQCLALKKLVGDLTKERREQLERELWVVKIRASAAVDILQSGRLKQSTIEMLQSVPFSDREPLLIEIMGSQDKKTLIDWFFGMPQPALTHEIDVDVKRLCCELSNLPLLSGNLLKMAAG
jgi:hypothetical protein